MIDPSQAADSLEDVSSIYVHHPVDRENTIRVLELVPLNQSEEANTISCRLQVITLDSPPAYRAISYMWGDPSITMPILVDGKSFSVRSNLWNFLSQMQEEGCSDVLWIDALSINQQDIAERSQQVSLMGQIYSKAAMVHVWLGPENDLNLVSMQILGVTDWSASVHETPETTSLPQLSQKGRETLEKAGLGLAMQGWGSAFKDLPPYPISRPFFEDEFLAPVLEFFNQDYWSRMWIIQEVVLAPRFIVQCGSEILDGDVLENFEVAMYDHELNYMSMSYELWARDHPEDKQAQESPIFTKELLDNLKKSMGMRVIAERAFQGKSRSELSYGLSRLITSYATHSCSVSHDYVYALLSLDEGAHRQIAPNYEQSTSDLFQEVTKVLTPEALGNGPEQLTNILQKTVVVGAIEQIAVALGMDPKSTLVQEAKRDATRSFGPLPIWGPAFGA
jgi:hypothetical protein